MRRCAPILLLALLLPACVTSDRPFAKEPVVPEILPASTVAPSGSGPQSSLPAAPSDARPARVVAVTDGDTVVLSGIEFGEINRATGGRKSRIIGVDTPEVFGRVGCYGNEASEFTKRELAGKTILVTFDADPVDRYGRALVYIWDEDGRFFNGRLVQQGYALQLTVPPNVRYAELFSRLVREAREQDRGLWSGCPVAVS